MSTIKETAEAYEQKQMKNIVDLDIVSVNQDIQQETKKNKDNEEYNVSYVLIAGDQYRVPNSVIEQIQTLLKAKPEMKTFKVTKKGENLNTSYTVIPMD